MSGASTPEPPTAAPPGTASAPLDNAAIARVLLELAALLELQQRSSFRVRAFRNAARAIEGLAEPCQERLRAGRLTEVRGIGAGIARRISELLATGRLKELAALRAQVPPGLVELLRVEGMGPKSVDLVWKQLAVRSIVELEAAARSGRLRALPGFGARREAKILRAIASYRRVHSRWTLTQARPLAEALRARLAALPAVRRVAVCGSLRRRCETVGDLDLLVAARPEDATRVSDRFVTFPEVREVIAQGETKTSVRLHAGIQADLRVVDPESWGAALHYFTGSKEHNIAVRARAVRRGCKISEYGVFDQAGRSLGGATEEEVFAAVGLPYIEPELREHRGELQAAAAGRLPVLIELADLRGDLHLHTDATDGRASLEEMVAAARALGHAYLAITDHSRALAVTHGMDPARLAAQGRRISAINEALGGTPLVLRGIEADILPDGRVDLGPEVLRGLDWVVASVHTHLELPRAEQTRRIVRALESGVVDCLGHPTGRLLGEREPSALDLEAILAAAARVGAAVELNASPDRLDLSDLHLRVARSLGVTVVISSDAHAPGELANLRFGVDTARRGWLERDDVANTLPAARFLERFADHHRHRSPRARR